MAVENLQAWADYTETVRLPQIESDVADLQSDVSANSVLLTQKIQEFTDSINANEVGISTAQLAATLADAKSVQAMTQLIQMLADAKAYTDQQVAAANALTTTKINAVNAYIDSDLKSYVDTQVTGNLPTLQGSLDAALAAADARITNLDSELASFGLASTDILDGTLPLVTALQSSISQSVTNLTGRMDTLTTGFSFQALTEGFEDVKAKNESDIAPMGGSVLRIPSSQWSKDVSTAYTDLAKPGIGNYGTFVTDDTDFGECYEFEDGTSRVIGPSFPIDFDPTRVYKITARFKVVDDGTGSTGVYHRTYAISQKGTNLLEIGASATLAPSEYLTIADGIKTVSYYVSADTAALDLYGVDAADRIDLSALSSTANKLYFGVRQNASALTDGKLRIASIYITDVTEALKSYQTIKTELTASIAGVNADLAINYYTIAGANAAIAAATTSLKSEMESPTGSVGTIQANLAQNYYTIAQVDSAISALETTLSSSIGSVSSNLSQNYYTKTEIDTTTNSAQSYADAAEQFKLSAETAAAQAGTSAANAASAKQDAEDAEAAALSYSGTAARLINKGVSHNPTFDKWTTTWPAGYGGSVSEGSVTNQAGSAKYNNCVRLDTAASPTAARPYLKLKGDSASDNYVHRAHEVERILVKVEIEKVSGVWGGACISGRWNGTSVVSKNVYLEDKLPDRDGVIFTVAEVIERPSGYVKNTALDEIEVFIFSTTVGGSGYQANNLRIHSFDYQVIDASAETLFHQSTKVTDDLSSAALVLRAKAGAATGSVEIASIDNLKSGAASKIKMTGDEIEFNGLSVFGDALKSTNFNGVITDGSISNTGSVGWAIDEAGNAVFNNLVARKWLLDGSVSDTEEKTELTATKKDDNSTFLVKSIGATSASEMWHVMFSFKARRRGTYESAPSVYVDQKTAVRAQVRYWDDAVNDWGAWEEVEDTATGWILGSSWQSFGMAFHHHGTHTNVGFRLVTILGVPGATLVEDLDNIKDATLYATAVKK